jgi:hydroxymethylbilane synthase
MKDVPAELPPGLIISATPVREDPRDVLISQGNVTMEHLSKGARIGTGSLRRIMQIKNQNRQIDVVPLRGNLDTRIRKVTEGALDGVVVAAAGMNRMGWNHSISQILATDVMLPAPCQGILGIETREEDPLTTELQALHDHTTWLEMTGERAFLKRLGGGCHLPIAALGKIEAGTIYLEALIGTTDNHTIIRRKISGPMAEAEELGDTLAETMLQNGGQEILDSLSCL